MYKVVLTELKWPEPDLHLQLHVHVRVPWRSLHARDVTQTDTFVILCNKSASLTKRASSRDSLGFLSDERSKVKTNIS